MYTHLEEKEMWLQFLKSGVPWLYVREKMSDPIHVYEDNLHQAKSSIIYLPDLQETLHGYAFPGKHLSLSE